MLAIDEKTFVAFIVDGTDTDCFRTGINYIAVNFYSTFQLVQVGMVGMSKERFTDGQGLFQMAIIASF